MAALVRRANPNLGFRGSPDGEEGTSLVNYGVYAQPIHRALLQYGYRSDVLMYATDAEIKSYLDRGWPVITWVTYALQRAIPRLAWADGSQFFLVPHEHAVLAVGYNSSILVANDPWVAKRVFYDWANFNRSWGYFGKMALAVEPCPMPQPISQLMDRTESPAAITWSWRPAINASAYRVQVVRHGTRDQVVYAGIQHTTQFTLGSPSTMVPYEITVRSLSACHDTSAARSRWTFVPAPPATPTPPPTPTTTPTATASATFPSPSSTPAPEITPKP